MYDILFPTETLLGGAVTSTSKHVFWISNSCKLIWSAKMTKITLPTPLRFPCKRKADFPTNVSLENISWICYIMRITKLIGVQPITACHWWHLINFGASGKTRRHFESWLVRIPILNILLDLIKPILKKTFLECLQFFITSYLFKPYGKQLLFHQDFKLTS